jgi:hypothetical protein
MRRSLLTSLLTLNVLLVASRTNAAPSYDWSYGFGGPGMNNAYDVAVDGSGNVIVAGAFTGTMDLGGGPLVSAGVYDVFLARFDATGAHQWSRRFGASGTDAANAVAVDGAGNITLTGSFQGSVSFGGPALTSRGGDDIFVARFDAAGTPVWSRGYGTTRDDEGKDVASDASGSIAVTGHYGAAIDFGAGATGFVGSVDYFLLKLDMNGAYKWNRVAGSTNIDEGFGVAMDAAGNVVATGSFFSTVNLGGSALVSAGLSDAFAVKYDANGVHQWSTRFGVSGISEAGQGIGVDASGAVVMTGTDKGAFLVKYDAAGVKQWNRSFVSSVSMQGLDLAVSSAGTIAMTGTLQGATNFGGGQLTSSGSNDIFLAVYDAIGVHRWSQHFGSTGDDGGYGCTFDAGGALIATGIFSSTVGFGGAPLISLGNADLYLVKFDDHVIDTTPPVITCPADVQVEQRAPAGTLATDPVIAAFLAGASASDDSDPAPVIMNDAPDTFPPGKTPVVFRAIDLAGNQAECTAHVTVVDSSPPRITVTLDKNMLWPPNHRFVTVCANVTVSDDGDTQPTWSLYSITCDEAADGPGDGHTPEDFRGASFGTPDACVDLRAERAGNGDGRVYEIVYAAHDGGGNTAYATAHVRVPHDRWDDESGQRSLTSVHPNPFNPETTIEYSSRTDARVRIDIYDARGSLVKRLVDGSTPAGNWSVTWTGLDDAGRPVGSGIYFVKLSTGTHVETRKLVLLK